MAEKPHWWKAKELSLKRKAAAALRPACAQPGDSFLIVTEGTVTEPAYFDLLRSSLQLSTVTVKVIPGKHSDPRHVIQSAADEVKTLARRVKRKKVGVTELERFDHVWAVIDTDVATRADGTRTPFWNDVIQKFSLEGAEDDHPVLCERTNVVVISDEAHRSQDGTKGRLDTKTGKR
jgi:RloB-like protein/SWI2/SNF2 ATPase